MGTVLSKQALDRVEEIMKIISSESKDIRDEVEKRVPAQNILTDLHANTFEEFALRPLARARGLDYTSPTFDYRQVRPPCPKCGKETGIKRASYNRYVCKCGKVYSANHDSISSGTNVDALVWMKVFCCMLNFYTIERVCDYCNIAKDTYKAIRAKIATACDMFLSEVFLYGKVYVDNTFVKLSYKGIELTEYDYPEDSPFYKESEILLERENRKGKCTNEDKYRNRICCYTAVSEYDRVLIKYVGIGHANANRLQKAVPESQYLKTVPEKDPLGFFNKNRKNPPLKKGEQTLLVSDKEGAIEKYAELIGLPIESHKFRGGNVQLALPDEYNDIQKVNSAHSRFKNYVRKSNYLASRNLPLLMTMFSFAENTGNSIEAIGRVMEIICTPGTHRPASFYEEKFAIPDRLLECLGDENPLSREREDDIYAFYLYSKRQEDLEAGREAMKVKEIEEVTGFTAKKIRRLYKAYLSRGFKDLIYDYFENKDQNKKYSKPKAWQTPEMHAVYQDYQKHRTLTRHKRPTEKDFFEINMNQKYGLNYSFSTYLRNMIIIETEGKYGPLPKYNTQNPNTIGEEHMWFLTRFNELVKEARQKGERPPSTDERLETISKETGKSKRAVRRRIENARIFLKNQESLIDINIPTEFKNPYQKFKKNIAIYKKFLVTKKMLEDKNDKKVSVKSIYEEMSKTLDYSPRSIECIVNGVKKYLNWEEQHAK